MKLTTVLLIVSLVQVSAASVAQKLTYVHKQTSMEQIIKEIRKQTGLDVLVSSNKIKNILPIDVNFKNTPLKEVLDTYLKDQPLTYEIQDKMVLIKEKAPSLVDKLKKALIDPYYVSGTVLDQTGQAISGVTIRVKGLDQAVTTDNKGGFGFSVPDKNSILIFSYIGYETQEIAAKDISFGSAVITLKIGLTNLHEVIINKGYYTERQELSTGNITVVSAKAIEQQPVSNPLAALEGRVPGLQITQSTGLPGGSFTVRLRGQNSLANSNDPFYVIDGVPYNAQIPLLPNNNTGLLNSNLNGGNPLNYLNPYDIESIEVLKDADATAIYGSRAANGAILITTKKGQAGQTKVDINLLSGFENPTNYLQLANTQQYLQVRHDAFKNDARSPSSFDYDLNGAWDTTRYTNWEKALTKPSHFSDANVTISGGNENTKILVGAGYHNEGTPFLTRLPGDGLDQKGSVHFNLNNISGNKKLKITLGGNYVIDKNTVQSSFGSNNFFLPPDAPALYNSDGSLNWMPLVAGQAGTWQNPVSGLLGKYQGQTNTLVSNALISYTILPGLELKSTFGYSNTLTNEKQILPTTSQDPGQHPTSGNSYFNTINSHQLIVEPQLEYKHTIGKGTISALLGTTYNESSSSIQKLSTSNYSSDALLEDPEAAGDISLNSASSQYRYNAIYGRFNYNLSDKYIINLTARRDGSSRFGPGKQFGNFGAVGAAWIFSKEKLIEQKMPWLSFGKLRSSYGTSGNDGIGDYQYVSTYSPQYYQYQEQTGLTPNNLFNPDLAWEIDKKLEIGLELGFLKDRVNLSVSYYRNRSSNQLVSTPVSEVTGFISEYANLPALVQNTGEELMLNTVNIKSTDFTWSSSFNISLNRNKLLSFPGLASSVYSDVFVIGQPLSIKKVFHMAGINSQTGQYQFEDYNGNLTYTPNRLTDHIVVENTTPQYFGGFENSFRYKSFSLDFLFQFVKQTGLNLFGTTASRGPLGQMLNFPTAYLNYWKQPGDVAMYEKPTQSRTSTAGRANGSAATSDFAYGDASFIRLKNLSFSWTAPKAWQQSLHLQNLRVYVQGQNLLTISGYNGVDPESQSIGLPPMKVWTLGLQGSF